MKYFAQQCVNKLEKANRMNIENDYLEKHRSLKLTPEEIENLKAQIPLDADMRIYTHKHTPIRADVDSGLLHLNA